MDRWWWITDPGIKFWKYRRYRNASQFNTVTKGSTTNNQACLLDLDLSLNNIRFEIGSLWWRNNVSSTILYSSVQVKWPRTVRASTTHINFIYSTQSGITRMLRQGKNVIKINDTIGTSLSITCLTFRMLYSTKPYYSQSYLKMKLILMVFFIEVNSLSLLLPHAVIISTCFLSWTI